MNDRDRIHCAIFLLKNKAHHWWEGTKIGVKLGNTTWEAFKVPFFEKYSSKNVRAQKLKEFLELKQENLPAAEYARRFEQGCLYAPFIAKDESKKTYLFLRGLNPVIRRDGHLTSTSTFIGTVATYRWHHPGHGKNLKWRRKNESRLPNSQSRSVQPTRRNTSVRV